MYPSIREYRIEGSIDELMQKVNEDFFPIISKVQGFLAYYCVDTGNGEVASISIFKDKAGIEESNRLAGTWVKENLASILLGAPEITTGIVPVAKISLIWIKQATKDYGINEMDN